MTTQTERRRGAETLHARLTPKKTTVGAQIAPLDTPAQENEPALGTNGGRVLPHFHPFTPSRPHSFRGRIEGLPALGTNGSFFPAGGLQNA